LTEVIWDVSYQQAFSNRVFKGSSYLHLESQTLVRIGLLDPEAESTTVLQNMSNYLPDYRVLHHTKLESFIV